LPLRRAGYLATTVLLTAIMAAAVLDATGATSLMGVHSEVVRDEGRGIELAVTYADASRPALATPFDIEVRTPGGFDEPVRIAVDREYLRLWDENGLSPAPSAETVMGPWVVWEFDPPIGDALLITYDARIEPAAQHGRSGAVAVLDEDDAIVTQVSFTTRVLP
jgi:hypothetical protein